MKTISIDIETFSSVDLGKSSVYRYVESPDFAILLFAYSIDGGAVQVVDLAQGETLPPAIIEALTDERVQKWAFNASFERVCLSEWLRRNGYSLHNEHYSIPEDTCMAYLDPAGWYCTMVWSAYLGLPLSLKDAGAALGLDKQKLSEGKDLIKYFCVPAKDGTRHLPADAPDRWATFKAYNLRDVETEMGIQERLRNYPVPDEVWEQYHLDQQINDRGIALDRTLVKNAIAMDEQARQELTAKLQELTMLDNPNSVQQMKSWLADNGLETDTLDKKQVVELLKTAPEPLKSVLVLRQQLAKSSVKKYQAMENTVCADGRVRGCFQFYGARTGRWAGRNIQLQNLPQNKMPDLEQARTLVRSGNYDAVRLLYDSTPDVLSQLIRTAFVPREGRTFFVADFSAIEARVLAWLAGEEWRMELFRQGGDIYCQSASQMFGVPVEKHGINANLRQKGKVAELACIAEGQMVLTDKGEVPIQDVTTDMKVWDGDSWVAHEGLVYRGEREVITYEGLTATPDHLVWVEGQSVPIPFGFAATSGAHLVQTGDRGQAVRLGGDHQPRKTLEQRDESLLCSDSLHGMQIGSVAGIKQSDIREIQGVSELFSAEARSQVAGQETDRSQATMRESERPGISELWRQRDTVQIPQHPRSGNVPDQGIRPSGQNDGNGSDQHERTLRAGEYPLCLQICESGQPQEHGIKRVQPDILALCPQRCDSETIGRDDTRSDHTGCGRSSIPETEKLAHNQRTARLYDLRNAGPHHRFTVSGHLVHNCGYGGSVGALKAMGAIEMGLQEEELKPLVDAWRSANPKIVKLWWEVDDAVMTAIRKKTTTRTHGLLFSCKSGMLFITLPSGRQLAYVKPRIGENQFGSPAATYMGTNPAKQWARLESYGPKFVENCIAGGTLVLAERGLVPIEQVKADDRLWDGVAWVSHEGLICQGMKETISVDGLRMTPEHKILTREGWVRADESEGFIWENVSLPEAQPESGIVVDHAKRSEQVYDIRNCGARHRFCVYDSRTGKLRIVSNCVQAISRDILCYAMQTLRSCSIVAHVHDELIIEADPRMSLEAVCEQMGRTPPWAQGLQLRADGYTTPFYKKD